MKKLLSLLLFLQFGAFAQRQTTDLSSATQEDLLMIQKKIAGDIVNQNGKVTSDQIDILSRISKSSNGTTVSFSKVPKEIFEADLKQSFQRCNMYFMALPEFRKFRRSLKMAYEQDTSVISRIIMSDIMMRNLLPKQYFIDLAKSREQ